MDALDEVKFCPLILYSIWSEGRGLTNSEIVSFTVIKLLIH